MNIEKEFHIIIYEVIKKYQKPFHGCLEVNLACHNREVMSMTFIWTDSSACLQISWSFLHCFHGSLQLSWYLVGFHCFFSCYVIGTALCLLTNSFYYNVNISKIFILSIMTCILKSPQRWYVIEMKVTAFSVKRFMTICKTM